MSVPVPEITFSNVVKHPLTYLLIMVSLGGGFLLNEVVKSGKTQNKDCQQEIVYWQTAFTTERNINLQITNALLDQRQDFKNFKDSTVKSDSNLRKKLLPKSLKVIKTHKP